MSVTWVTRQGWEGGRGDRLWDYLLHTIKSHTLHGERKGPTWPTSVTLATGTSLREAAMAVLSSTRSGPMAQISRLAAAWSCAPNPAAT